MGFIHAEGFMGFEEVQGNLSISGGFIAFQGQFKSFNSVPGVCSGFLLCSEDFRGIQGVSGAFQRFPGDFRSIPGGFQ